MTLPPRRRFIRSGGSMLVCACLAAAPARAGGNYDFVSSPHTNLNRIYHLDKETGEVGACRFGIKDGAPIGATLCYPAGEGAGPQGAGDYALVASHHVQESGVWRVDLRTGKMSSCYVLNGAVVCTPPEK